MFIDDPVVWHNVLPVRAEAATAGAESLYTEGWAEAATKLWVRTAIKAIDQDKK